MSSIGSIYDETPQGEGRGPDLRATVSVPRAALGQEDGVHVPLPAVLPHEGGEVERAPQPGEPADAVTLRLPADFPDGATLRLRGAGGRGGQGAGDLFLKVALCDEALEVAPSRELVAQTGSSTPIVVMLGIVALTVLLFVLFG